MDDGFESVFEFNSGVVSLVSLVSLSETNSGISSSESLFSSFVTLLLLSFPPPDLSLLFCALVFLVLRVALLLALRMSIRQTGQVT